QVAGESSDQEESPIEMVDGTMETADDTSPAQSTSGNINRRPGPKNFFDKPIPLLSLQV
ncbi:hypothetical protein IWQ62_003469, partial [Dispira parvispora]